MTTDQIIDGILEREKQGAPPYLAPGDAGGRTSWGISERAYPDEWKPGPPSRARAREIYLRDFVAPFAPLQTIVAPPIIAALVDDAVLSGPDAAIKRFQFVLGVTMDGKIGPQTLHRAQLLNQIDLLKRFVVERAIRITRLVQRRPSDLVNLTGWVARILKFLP